eukprot:2747560-Rhodomonas_salina.1
MLLKRSGAKVAASDGRAASCKGLVQRICAACAAVLPLWVVPRQARCWAQSGCHERRNFASACGYQVSSVRWSWNKHKGRTDEDLRRCLASVWRPLMCWVWLNVHLIKKSGFVTM